MILILIIVRILIDYDNNRLDTMPRNIDDRLSRIFLHTTRHMKHYKPGMVQMEKELMRICISMNDRLLKKFDGILEISGCTSRSEGIQEAIKNYIQYYDWMGEVEGERVGIISIIYEQAQHGILNVLVNTHSRVMSAIDLPLDEESYFEIITVKDDGRNVRELAESIMALKGVKHVKLMTIKLQDP